MKRSPVYLLVGLVMAAILQTTPSLAGDRPPATILDELDGTTIPSYDASRKLDESYNRDFLTQVQKSTQVRNALILELFRTLPNHDRIPTLMAERWSIRPYSLTADVLSAEINEILAHTTNPGLKVEGEFARAFSAISDTPPQKDFDPAVIDRFLKFAPEDARGAKLLRLAASRSRDEKAKVVFENRILAEFPDTEVARKIVGVRNRPDLLGKPFELEFRDAISGTVVRVADFKGKLLIIDFWATWCVPCVEKMPEMKSLHEKYQGRGVEFLGVSLDKPIAQGGLDRLKSYVKEHAIPWPQYYQGDGWDSRFSVQCGIRSIPTVFVLDDQGIVRSIDAQSKLEEIIQGMIKARGKPRD